MRNSRNMSTTRAIAWLAVALSLGAGGPATAQKTAQKTSTKATEKAQEKSTEKAAGDGSTAAESRASPTSAGSPSSSTTTTVEDSEHALGLRDLEEKVNDLKGRVFRSKARLILLRETVMSSAIAGSRARIVHRNEMGAAFSLREVSYSLDGTPLLNQRDTDGSLDDREEIELFNGAIVPGNHNLSVHLVYQGNGYGIFSYLKGYTFKIKSSYAFTAEEGKLITVKAVAYEKGGITTDLKDRPAMRYDVEVAQAAGRSGDDESAPASAQGEVE